MSGEGRGKSHVHIVPGPLVANWAFIFISVVERQALGRGGSGEGVFSDTARAASPVPCHRPVPCE